MLEKIQIRPFKVSDIEEVKNFTDQWIGQDYYSLEDLKKVEKLSHKNKHNCSFVAVDKQRIVAVRLTHAPGVWSEFLSRGLTPHLWNCSFNELAYFKSLFVSEDYQAQGLGKRLSDESLKVLKLMGAKAVLCHSWIESPGDSSRKYLKKFGFHQVAQHPNFWKPIDYLCTRCAPQRCECTAAEMIYYLQEVMK